MLGQGENKIRNEAQRNDGQRPHATGQHQLGKASRGPSFRFAPFRLLLTNSFPMTHYVRTLIAFSLITASLSYNIANYPQVWAMLEGGRAQIEQMNQERQAEGEKSEAGAGPHVPLGQMERAPASPAFNAPRMPEAVAAPVMPPILMRAEPPVRMSESLPEPALYEPPVRPHHKSAPIPLELLGGGQNS